MASYDISRRKLLRRSAAGASVVALGSAASAKSQRKLVSFNNKGGVRAAKAKADNVHRTIDLEELGTIVAANMSDKAIDQLKRNHDVNWVEDDGLMHALHHRDGHGGGPGGGDGGDGGSTSQTLPWGIDRVDADVAHANGEDGAGAHIAILDTGIDSDHPDLQANLGSGKAFTKCKGGSCNYNWDDDNDHGTHCAGSADAVDNSEGVVGVSTNATLHAVKVLGKRGSGSFSDISAGVKYVADQGWDVASMSLGASSGSQALADACQYAVDRGVLIVAAAGNSGPCTDCVGYPAAYSTTLAVGSTDCDDTLSSFSSTGPEVDIAAPGGAVLSTVPGGGYDTFSGTSMATPHVAGAAGQLMANGASNSNAESTLLSSAEDIGLASNEGGAGLLDVAAALNLDSSDNGTGNGPNC